MVCLLSVRRLEYWLRVMIRSPQETSFARYAGNFALSTACDDFCRIRCRTPGLSTTARGIAFRRPQPEVEGEGSPAGIGVPVRRCAGAAWGGGARFPLGWAARTAVSTRCADPLSARGARPAAGRLPRERCSAAVASVVRAAPPVQAAGPAAVVPAAGRSGARTSTYVAPAEHGSASTRAAASHLACGRVASPK